MQVVENKGSDGNIVNTLLGDVYRQILQFFVSDDEMRPAMMRPFIQGEYAIATDRHIIICFKKNLLNDIDFLDNDKVPDALSVIPEGENMSIEFDTIEIRKKITNSHKIANETYEVKYGKCPDCNGNRFVCYKFTDYKGKQHEVEDICPTCENGNDFKIIKNKKNGNEIESFRELFKIDNALLDVNLFERIVKVAELLSIPQFKLVYKKHETALHKFIVGECTICMMPISQATDDDLVQNIA